MKKQTYRLINIQAHAARKKRPRDSENQAQDDDEGKDYEQLLKLAIKWNCFDQAADLLENLQYMNVIYLSI